MFKELKRSVQDRFEMMCKDQVKLFTVNPDRDKIWDLYLESFTPETRQHHNCNCCKSFLRQYGGIVAIINGEKVTMWSVDAPEEYQQSIKNVNDYIQSLPIQDVFLNTFVNLGTDKNAVHANPSIIWEHFYVKLPNQFVHRGSESIESLQGTYRDNKNVLQRSLNELTIDAIETVLELINQGSLYRGNEFKGMVETFQSVKTHYDLSDSKDNYCWVAAVTLNQALCRIRNTSIGTLLIDLSNGVDLDTAVRSFERVVAPSNYKRPVALVTPKMVEEAKKKLQELGYMESLDRRYANESDLNVNDTIFTDKSSQITDVFQQMSKDAPVNPKSFTKVEEITIDDFITNVVPTSKSIEVLLENKHLNNMVSLLTAVNSNAPSMFKWNNPFSWSYAGGITDSIKERVKQAGGNVEGVLRVSLSWYNYDDLDLHVIEPSRNEIYFRNLRNSNTTGYLDVDMNAGSGKTRSAVENIAWTNKSKMLEGKYIVAVNNYVQRETIDSGFVIQIEYEGQTWEFEHKVSPRTSATVNVIEFDFNKINGITITGQPQIVSKTKWGLNTNQFHKVSKLMFSPNHWNSNTGNKHFLFFLENCISDESPRPFFNEFLKEELVVQKRFFETLAGKLKVEPTNNQLSGIGFSDTQPNELIVRVEGSFKRTLKIKI